MQIVFQREPIRQVSAELLALSKTVRQSGFEVEDVLRALRLETEFESCKHDLKRQEENAYLLTARLVSLSNALNEIGRLYDRIESANEERLESASNFYRPSVSGTLRQSGNDTHMRLERILSQ
ncbi:MAG: hypothetical protein IJQ81_10810 [Oscillibacter sp.]|nr:hypothetical protein [Oscillibacter sp.]